MSTLDAKGVFVQALRFDRSAQVLLLHLQRSWSEGEGITQKSSPSSTYTAMSSNLMPPTFVSALVCEAFSVELYLKTIYSMEKLTYPKAHDLYSLFSGLPNVWQGRLRTKFQSEFRKPSFDNMRTSPECPKDIDACLRQAAKSFQIWRYSFEFVLPSHFLSPARIALLNAIIDVEPTWKELPKTIDVPPKRPTR